MRNTLQADTENLFNLLDRIRKVAPEDTSPWLDEVELSLQFSDRVAQQITALASILRDLLKVMTPKRWKRRWMTRPNRQAPA